jgi:endonuclease/exonuclease/phosphatase family metal-dependent hydrolase
MRVKMTVKGWLSAMIFCSAGLSLAQFRVCTYNLTFYAGGRVTELQTALLGTFEGRSVTPDVLIVQEMTSLSAAQALRNLLNAAPAGPGDYALATFVDGPDTDSAMYYRTSRVTFVQAIVVATGGTAPNHPRNIMRYDVRPSGYSGPSATLAVYSSHMKAGTTTSDRDRRLLECERIRTNAQNLGLRPFILGGDFNMQTSSEAGYQELVGSKINNNGQFFDPVKSPGTWNRNSAMRFLHSQDPVPAGVGMDDRFDQLLLSSNLLDGKGFHYLGNPNVAFSTTTWNDPNHSYRTWGNDGTSFGTSIRVSGNTMVGPTIAQALIDAAGGFTNAHLPVFLDLKVPPKVTSPTVIDFGTALSFSHLDAVVTVTHAGDVSKWGANGLANLEFSLEASQGFQAPSGTFVIPPGSSQGRVISVDTSTPGLKTGTLVIRSNDPDQPERTVSLVAFVLPFGYGSGLSRID